MKKNKPKMKKRILAVVLTAAMLFTMVPAFAMAGEAADLEWYNFRNNAENNGITDKTTPNSAETATLKWAEKYGTGWGAAPTTPLILDGHVYVGMSNKVLKIDKNTGKKVAESDEMVAGVGFAMNPITYADGKLFVQVGNGIIQAIDYETLKCVWSTEKIGGQTVSPISYAKIDGKGYIYTGTWRSPSSDGAFMCVSTDDSNVNEDGIKKAEWKFVPSGGTDTFQNVVYEDTVITYDEELKAAVEAGTAKDRGFYWSGAYACEKYVAVGSDDGESDYGSQPGESSFYILNPKTGKIIDKINGIKGDIRTSIVYDDGYLYFASREGTVYKVSADEAGHIKDYKTLEMGGAITASPVVYNGRLYVGVAGSGGQFNPDGGHTFAVVDTESMTKIYDLPIKGYPQASALLSTAYENEDFDGDGKADGRVYLYFTYNSRPGGIYYTYDAKNQGDAAAESGELFIPEQSMQNYCLSTICTDNDGTLYYKNDSCNLMAVSNSIAYLSDISIDGAKYWNREFKPGVTDYEVVLSAGVDNANIRLEMPLGVKALINGNDYNNTSDNYISLKDGKADVKIEAVSESGTTTYNLKVRCESSDSSLKNLFVSESNTFGDGEIKLAPEFRSDKTVYEADVKGIDKNFFNIWPELSDSNAEVKVYGLENVNADTLNEDGSLNIASDIEGHDRYAVYPADKSRNTKVRIEVTSESGEKVTNYEVTLVKENTVIPGESANDDSSSAPKTGDNSFIIFWILAAVLSCSGALAVILRKRETR